MTNRILAAFREVFLAWDRYSALQFNAPLTHALVRRTDLATAR